ncbi:MAG: chromate transporter [Oscillospiraceae bacterium]|jgi:chromate transporter|nr:chromate transporter [Oscillospiraceae bacterium]
MILLRLALEFFAIGLLSIGGGLATVPFLEDLSARTGWFTAAELSDMIAVSESTPGPIGVNMAAFVGFKTAGIPGVVCAAIGLAVPSVAVILIVAKALEKFRGNRYISGALGALRPASLALIASVGVSLFISAAFPARSFDWRSGLIIVLALPPMLKTKLHPFIYIALAAAAGIALKM